jgi:hypothetical protein
MLNDFLDWFDRNKLGIIGTLAVHTLLLFLLTLWHIRATPRDEDRSEMRIEIVSDERAEELIEQMDQEDEAGMPAEVLSLTQNILAELTKPSFSQERLSERVEQDLHELERSEFERLAEERRERGEEVTIPELDPSKWDKELYMEKAAEPARVEGSTAVWHDLKEPLRAEQQIQIPAYLCRGFGQVVVQVAVDRSGQVRKATFDPLRSTTRDECMVEHAVNSARRARFAPHSAAPDLQNGSIYYRFMPQ